jgi:hypothetical protein
VKYIFKKWNWVLILAIATGILAIATAIAQGYKDKQDEVDRLKDKNDIIQLQQKNINLQKSSIETLKQITALQARLIEANNNLIEANKRIEKLNDKQFDYITGGNSFGYVFVLRILDDLEQDVCFLAFEKKGDNPLYDVQITYWNPDDFLKHREDERAILEDINKYKTFKLGDIFGTGSQMFGIGFKISESQTLKFNLNIHTKNRDFSELLRIHKVRNKNSYAYKVYTVGTKSHVVLKHVDRDFPVNEKGEIDWN